MTAFGNWTLGCERGFTPAELAEAAAEISELVELRYIGGLSRAQAGFVHAAQDAAWVHITLWDPKATGMVLQFERDRGVAEPPFDAKVETEVADGFADDTMRRSVVADLAKRVVERACEKLGMKVTAFDAK